ncbi:hypothetical protein [Rudgehvirus jaberico]|uniref:Right handed beta helix domain-containing protein n=1 Tax=Caudoviricetes sp. 'Rudgehvirus jaberico' TaxID=3028515 RepID=A0AAF0D550_9CAUD|nr:hypothetical protein [Caudoviricetes sp. 'Rudgehvirus jaberico']
METNNRKQLVTQDNGNIEKIFPKNYMSNIVDEETGESLRIFLLKYNHIDLGYRSSKSSARLAVPIIMRRKGLYITYYLPNDIVITEFFNGNKTEVSDTNWVKDELWVKDVNELNVYDVKISDGSITLDKLSEEVMQLISSKGDITINNFPDNEDLELYTIYQDSNNKIDAIRFKDRDNSNGMAYKYLRKTKNMILSQSDFNQANTIYEIRYDFDLNGSTISIPDNCELKFIGGSLKNGTINFNNTLLNGNIKIKTNISGNIRNNEVNVLWFNVTGDGNADDRNAIQEVIDIVSESTTILFPKVSNFYNVIIAKGNGNTTIEQRANAVYSGSLYPLTINKNNITIVIRGIIKSTNILGNMFEVSGNNIVIIGEDGKLQGIGGTDNEGFLDTNTSDTTLQWHPCLIKINGDNCRINNLSFEDYPTHGIDCYGKALIVDSCLFIGGRIEHSTTGGTVLMGIRTNTGADSVIIKNNRFIANPKGGKCYSCIFPSGDKFIISNNICEKYHEHAVYAYGNYGSIIDNKFTDVDCIASDIQYFATYGIIKGNFSIGTEGFIQIMHGKGTIVEGNTVTNCRGGIIVRPYHTVDVDKLPSGLKLLNNFIELTVGTTGSCLSFYVLGTYDISDILISGNTFANGYYTQTSQVAASLLIGAGSSENNGIKFLRVENNVIRSGRGAVSWLKGIHNSIFKNNKFISESLNDVASAFSFAINANYVTNTIFEGNEFIDVKDTPTLARAIQLNTGTTNLSVIDNNIINYTSNIYLDYDTYTKLIYKRNNRRNYLPLAGTYDDKPNAYAQEYGAEYYDKDNQVPMWWSGVRWKDAEGCYIVLSKSDINTPNKIYKIRFNIDLGGTTLTLPANCTLDFQGGSFSNGTIVGSNTRFSGNIKLDTTLTFSGTYLLDTVNVDWFYTTRGSDASPYIQAALDFAKLIKASVTFGNKLTSGYIIKTTLNCDVPIIGNNARLSSTTVGVLNCKNECSIENLYIDFYPYQGASDVTDNKVIAINIGGETSTYNHYINNVTIDGFYYGIVMTNSWNLRCSNLRIIRTRIGIQAYGKCVNNSIVNANIDCKGTNSICIAFNDEVDHAASTYLSEGWTISNSILTSAQYGIFGVNMSNTFISNCIIDLCSKNAIKFSLNSLNIRIVDNYLACLANGIDVINFSGQNVLNNEDAGIIISNNTIKSYYSDSGSCNGINIGEGTYESIYILGNTISNLGGIGIVSLNGEITHINVSDNRFKINVGGYFYVLKATNKYIANNNAIDNYNNSGIKVANKMIIVADSAPTSNTKTWNAGDICLNSNASVGSIIGWFCATSGSPGTWFPIGTIEQYAGLKKQGTTAERPAMNQNYIGATYYDTTLKKVILWNGTTWTNVDGTALT